MSLHNDLRTLLNGWSEVTSLLPTNSTALDKPIRPERLYQSDPLPAIEISIPEVSDAVLDADAINDQAEVIFSVIALEPNAANAIAEAMLTRNQNPSTGLHGYKGTAGSLAITVNVTSIKRGYAKLPDGSDSGEYVVEIHSEIWINS